MSAAPKLALVPASRYNCNVKLAKYECLCQVSLGLKGAQKATKDLKLNMVLIFIQNMCISIIFMFATPKLALVPASHYNCNVK